MQRKFFEFRQKCINGVIVNHKYHMSGQELKEGIDNIVLDLRELREGVWEVVLESEVIDNSNVLHIEKK